MPKRFTDTAKFSDPWYRKLPIEYKLLWEYLYCTCDGAGVIDIDIEHAEFCIGTKLDIEDFIAKSGEDRIMKLSSGKLYLCKFIQFQYGPVLSHGCKPHCSVMKLIDKHQLSSFLPKGMLRVPSTLKEKEKEKDKKRKPQNAGGEPLPAEERYARLEAETGLVPESVAQDLINRNLKRFSS